MGQFAGAMRSFYSGYVQPFHSESCFNPIVWLWVPNYTLPRPQSIVALGKKVFLLFARITVITFLLEKTLNIYTIAKKINRRIQVYANNIKNNKFGSIDIGSCAKQQKTSLSWTLVDHWGTLEPITAAVSSLFANMDWTTFAWSFCALSMADWQNTPPPLSDVCELWSELPTKK